MSMRRPPTSLMVALGARACLHDPRPTRRRPEPRATGVHPHPLPDTAAALAWLDAERATLRATATLGHYHTAWHLAWNLTTFYLRLDTGTMRSPRGRPHWMLPTTCCRSSGCLPERSRNPCGSGTQPPASRSPRSTWPGRRSCAGSTSSTPSACSSKPSAGPRRNCAHLRPQTARFNPCGRRLRALGRGAMPSA